jgi:hypothetical protein
MIGWIAAAREAEERGDWDKAISIVSAVADIKSPDDNIAQAHFWHIVLLARAGRLDELAELAKSDGFARRQLDIRLREDGNIDELGRRAREGDKFALYQLLRLLRARGDKVAAERLVNEVDSTNAYAWRLVHESTVDQLRVGSCAAGARTLRVLRSGSACHRGTGFARPRWLRSVARVVPPPRCTIVLAASAESRPSRKRSLREP